MHEESHLPHHGHIGYGDSLWITSFPGYLWSIFELGELIQLDVEVEGTEPTSRVDKTGECDSGGCCGKVHPMAEIGAHWIQIRTEKW